MCAHELAERGDVQAMMLRGEDRQVLFRESKQTHGRLQTSAVFWVRWVVEIFLQMNKGAGRLN